MSSAANKSLKFKRVDVSFIYGYVNYNLYKSMEPPQGESNGFNEMWAPIYNLNRSADGFYIQDLTEDLIKNESIKIIGKNNPNGINAKLSAHILRKRYNQANPKETDGGPGALTIKISVESHSKETIDVKTIYDILHLVPKTSAVFSKDLSQIEGLGYFDMSEISGRVSRYSSIFKLFCNLLFENQKCWNELYLPPHEGCFERCESKCERFYSFYDTVSQIDPQIPYIFVEGFLPKDDFDKGFMDKNCDNSMYTNEIGCLLERWLTTFNFDHLNLDYYSHSKDNDVMIDDNKGAFISRYRDKKIFTLFSSMVTLLLKSEYDYGIEASQLTTNSFLSYLQFSRIQLHNILWLSKQLDKLINEVDDKKTVGEMLPSKNKLNVLKVKIAKSMNCPIFYMLDSVFGQEIPTTKISRNVKKLEEDTIKKLNLLNELISDKIGVIQLSELYKSLN
jgi:hypothetical protein